MPRASLGDLEHLILVAILRLRSDAYGAAIIDEIEARTQRELSHAAVYISLQRMDAKGFVTAHTAAGTTERGGRAKSIFEVTELGRDRLRQTASDLFSMWEGLDPTLRTEGGR